MKVVTSMRMLALAGFWPLAAVITAREQAVFLEDWFKVVEVILLGLALVGSCTAGFFSRWRITAGFLLILLAWAGLRFEDMPLAMTLLPVLGLCAIPWVQEKGATGAPLLVTGALGLISLSLWLRGDPPAGMVDDLLTTTVSAGEKDYPVTVLVASAGLVLLGLRLLLQQDATDLALGSALGAMVLVALQPIAGPAALVAVLTASLALWTGLLMHAWRLAYLDELTGLPNRRALEDRLRARPGSWCLAMMDVDHFKKFNDRWGHDIGDQVLRRVAAQLRQVSKRGRAFRYGGEEFAIFFPHGDLERAAGAVEQARTAIGAEPFRIRGFRSGPDQRGKKKSKAEQRITASGGITCGKSGEAVEMTFKRADQALYKAKSKGRNRLVTDTPKS